MLRTHVKPGSFVPLREPVSISGMEIPHGSLGGTVCRHTLLRRPQGPGGGVEVPQTHI